MSVRANATEKPEKGVYITSMATTFPNMNTKVKKKIRCFLFSKKKIRCFFRPVKDPRSKKKIFIFTIRPSQT
jgi:hypothetical protein